MFRDITNRGLPKKNTYSAMIQTKINKNNFARKVLNHNVYLEDNYTVADTPGLQKTNRYVSGGWKFGRDFWFIPAHFWANFT